MDRSVNDRSLGDLFGELTRETSTLVRQEMQLAKTELSQKASSVGKDVGSLAVGGAIAYAGLLALIAAVIVGLGSMIPMWLSALIVGVVVAGIGFFMLQKGLNALKQENLAPKQTIETVKEDAEWAKEQMR